MNFETALSVDQEKKNSNIFILYVWPGEWSLPSLDAECLTALVIYFI